jgi:hypothetical protein
MESLYEDPGLDYSLTPRVKVQFTVAKKEKCFPAGE